MSSRTDSARQELNAEMQLGLTLPTRCTRGCFMVPGAEES